MIYIYNCYGGTHSSSLAAAVHLKKLPSDRTLTREDILNVDYFNKLRYSDMGRIIYRGTDADGNRVYTVGRGTSKVLVPCIRNLVEILQHDYGLKEKLVLSNTSPSVPFAMTMGGFFSRGLGVDFIGVPLLVVGAKQAHGRIIKIVENTKKSAAAATGEIVVLDNKD